jgi:hypothetical protein
LVGEADDNRQAGRLRLPNRAQGVASHTAQTALIDTLILQSVMWGVQCIGVSCVARDDEALDGLPPLLNPPRVRSAAALILAALIVNSAGGGGGFRFHILL